MHMEITHLKRQFSLSSTKSRVCQCMGLGRARPIPLTAWGPPEILLIMELNIYVAACINLSGPFYFSGCISFVFCLFNENENLHRKTFFIELKNIYLHP